MAQKAVANQGVSDSPIIAPSAVVTSPKVVELNPRQKAEAILKKYTVKSSEGQNMFVKEDEVYREMSMTADEAEKFLGGRDPSIYFKDGLVHTSLKGYFGDLLEEDRDEVMTMKRVIKNIDIPVFKHRRFNQYLLLIPKVYSENELDANNEYESKVVHQDYRVIAFTGLAPVPSAFEESFFMKECEKILANLKRYGEPRGLQVS